MFADLNQLLLVFTAYIKGAASRGPSNMRIMGIAAPMTRIYRRACRWIEGTLAVVYGAASMKLLLSRS